MSPNASRYPVAPRPAPTDSTTPRSSPPQMAPTMLPIPPRTVTTKAFKVKIPPTVGKT